MGKMLSSPLARGKDRCVGILLSTIIHLVLLGWILSPWTVSIETARDQQQHTVRVTVKGTSREAQDVPLALEELVPVPGETADGSPPTAIQQAPLLTPPDNGQVSPHVPTSMVPSQPPMASRSAPLPPEPLPVAKAAAVLSRKDSAPEPLPRLTQQARPHTWTKPSARRVDAKEIVPPPGGRFGGQPVQTGQETAMTALPSAPVATLMPQEAKADLDHSQRLVQAGGHAVAGYPPGEHQARRDDTIAAAALLASRGGQGGAPAGTSGGGDVTDSDPMPLPIGNLRTLPQQGTPSFSDGDARPLGAKGQRPVAGKLGSTPAVAPGPRPELVSMPLPLGPSPAPVMAPAAPRPRPVPPVKPAGPTVLTPVDAGSPLSGGMGEGPALPTVDGTGTGGDGWRVTTKVTPIYPQAARRRGVEGVVHLRVKVDARGVPMAVEVEGSSGRDDFDTSAVQAVKQWRFALEDNFDYTERWLQVRIEFRLQSD